MSKIATIDDYNLGRAILESPRFLQIESAKIGVTTLSLSESRSFFYVVEAVDGSAGTAMKHQVSVMSDRASADKLLRELKEGASVLSLWEDF